MCGKAWKHKSGPGEVGSKAWLSKGCSMGATKTRREEEWAGRRNALHKKVGARVKKHPMPEPGVQSPHAVPSSAPNWSAATQPRAAAAAAAAGASSGSPVVLSLAPRHLR